MVVKRIVANVASEHISSAKAFYGDVLGMSVIVDLGWMVTFSSEDSVPPEISIAKEGGSGRRVPDPSIEVDDLDEVYRQVVAAGLAVEYGLVSEPWGVKRFYICDPFGRLVNILAHE